MTERGVVRDPSRTDGGTVTDAHIVGTRPPLTPADVTAPRGPASSALSSLFPGVSKQRLALELQHYLYRTDFRRFALDQLKISPKEGLIIPFDIAKRPAQEVYLASTLRQLEEQGFARQIWLKNRQQGGSTLGEGMVFWRCVLNKHTNGFIVAHDKETAETLFRKIQMFYQYLDADLRPMVKHATKGEITFDNPDMKDGLTRPGLGGRIVVETARNIHAGTGHSLNVVHLCLDPETILWTSNGLKPMREVTPGEVVVTGEGRETRVKAIAVNPSDDRQWVAVHVWGVPQFPLRCTDDHRVLTTTGWKAAGSLTRKDWLLMPIRRSSERQQLIDLDGYFRARYSPKKNRIYDRWAPADTRFPLDYEHGWVVGLFLAEGTLARGKTTFCLGWGEERYAERVTKILERFCKSISVVHRKHHQLQVECYSAGLEEFFRTTCYQGTTHRAHTKAPPPFLYDAPLPFVKGMVHGYFAGDGNVGGRGTRMNTVSPYLAAGIRDALVTTGYGWPNIRFHRGGVRGGRNERDQWMVIVGGPAGQRLAMDWKGSSWSDSTRPDTSTARLHYPNHLAVKIKRIEQITAPSEMMDIEVEDAHHSFRCLQAITANSELARYEKPEELQSSVFDTVPMGHQSIIIAESTGFYNPDTNWFQSFCDDARLQRKHTPWRFSFVGWHEDPTCVVPTPADLVLDYTDEEREMIRDYRLTDAQLLWRRFKIGEFGGSVDLFMQSYPITHDQAWLIRGTGLLTGEQMRDLKAGVREPLFVGDLQDFDPKRGGWFLPKEDGPLRIWEFPEPGEEYDVGVDVAMGLGQNYTVACVLRRRDKLQVAQYRSNTIDPGRPLIDALARLGTAYTLAQMAIEVNPGGGGHYTNTELQKIYPNIFIDKHYNKVSSRTLTSDTGWLTTPNRKMVLVATAIDWLGTGRVTLRDETTWDELRTFRNYGDKQYAALPGKFDDCVMALFIAIRASVDETYASPPSEAEWPMPETCVMKGCQERSMANGFCRVHLDPAFSDRHWERDKRRAGMGQDGWQRSREEMEAWE